MNSKMTTNSQLLTTELKSKNKLSKQLEQEHNQRIGYHMESFQWRGEGEEYGRKVQGIRSIIGRYKIAGGC